MDRARVRTAFAFALIASVLFVLQVLAIPPEVTGTPDDRGTFNLTGIYWPSIGRDHSHRFEGSTNARALADPVVKWDHSSNSTSLGSVAANFTENVAFSGMAPREVFGVASSNFTHLQLRDGENGTLMWSADVRDIDGTLANRLYLSPIILNVNPNSKMEIFCVVTDGNIYRGALFEPSILLNQTGYHFSDTAQFSDRIWISDPVTLGQARYSSPIVFDINADKVEDLIFGIGNYLVALNGTNGKSLWQRQIGPLGEILSPPAVFSSSSSSLNRIVVNSLYNTKNRIRTTTVNFNGQHLNNVTYDLSTQHSGVVPMPAVGDITGDGEPEIVCSYPGLGGTARIRAFSYTLSLISTASMLAGAFESSCSLADIDGDSVLDVVMQTRVATPAVNTRMYCFEVVKSGSDWTFKELWFTDAPIQTTSLISPPLVCDLDKDGSLDAVFFAGRSAICLDENGKQIWRLNVSGAFFQGSGIVGDLGRDQFSDILCDGIMISQRVIDLYIAAPLSENLMLSDPSPVEGKEITITCIVSNSGNAPADNVVVSYFENYGGNDRLIGNETLPQVVETRESTMRWTPARDGMHQLTVRLDPVDRIVEQVETNNQESIVVNVMRSVPDLNVSGIGYYRADGEKVDGQTKNLVSGDPSRIVATVVNLGYRAASEFSVTLAIDGETEGIVEVGTIAGGEGMNVSFAWTPDYPQGKEVLVTVFCDLNNVIDETSESNNNFTETTNVKSPEPSAASYILTGTVRDPQGDLVSDAKVVLKDNRTGETLTQFTNLGIFHFDPASLASGYLDGDQMEVHITKDKLWGKAYFRVYSQDGGKALSINLSAIPTAGVVMDPSGSIEMTLDPGIEKRLPFKINNTGNVKSQISVSVDLDYVATNSSGWIASTDNSSFLLDPGTSGEVALTLIVPTDAAPADKVLVIVACSINGTVLTDAELHVTVSELAKLLIEMPPDDEIVLDSSETVKELPLYIENVGNVEVDYRVEMAGDLASFTTISREFGNLTPGESVEPTATIDLSGETGTFYGELRIRSNKAPGAILNLSVEIVLPNIAVNGEIAAEPPGRVLNEEITLSINVKNEGKTTLKSFNYAFYVDDVTLGLQEGEDLAPDGSAVLLGSWIPTKEGRHVVSVKLDPDDVLRESNEDDNVAERTFMFHPDLVIKSGSVSDYRPTKGAKVTSTIEIENRGAAGVGGYTVTIGTGSGDPLFTKNYVKTVSAGDVVTETLEFTVPTKAGKYSLEIRVDVPTGTTDADVSNNVKTEEITVVEASTRNNLPFIIGSVIAGLVVLAVAVFLLVRFGVISRDRTETAPPDGSSQPPAIMDTSFEEPAMEMRLEPIEPPVRAMASPIEAEILEVPEIVSGQIGGEDEGLIPEV